MRIVRITQIFRFIRQRIVGELSRRLLNSLFGLPAAFEAGTLEIWLKQTLRKLYRVTSTHYPMEQTMRLLVTTLVSVLLLSACASESVAPSQNKSAEAPKPVARCYSGDDDKFYAVGQNARVSGVDVTCSATSDGKSGQWMGMKHK